MRNKRVSVGLAMLLVIIAVTLFVTGSHAIESDNANLPTAYFQPTVLYFTVGTTSTRTTTLVNSSGEPLQILSFAMQGTHPNFTMTHCREF
jgi:hypothetical protein